MSISPTAKLPPCHSALDWARNAIAAPKVSGPDGYRDFDSGGWMHWWHYAHISKSKPELSPPSAIPEMIDVKTKLETDILRAARQLDAMIQRLGRMEFELASVQSDAEYPPAQY